MPSVIIKITLVVTGLAPVLLTLGIVSISQSKLISLFLFLATALLAIISNLIIIFFKRGLASHKIKINSVKTADQDVLSFLIAYLSPLITLKITEINYTMLVATFLLIGIIIYHSNTYHFNPLLGVFGFHFYEVTTEENVTFILMSKRFIRNCREPIKVACVSEYMLIELGVDRNGL